MNIKDEKVYQDWKDKNKDEYGACIFRYTEKWADLMEAEIDKGNALEKVAQDTSHTADTEGITGNMYGMAVHVLSICWIHGEQLRVWHNKKYGQEGEGTVNPAVIHIK